MPHHAQTQHRLALKGLWHGSYKRMKGRSHTVEKRLNMHMHPHKPHARVSGMAGLVEPVRIVVDIGVAYDIDVATRAAKLR